MISTKGRYALRVMVDLIQHQEEGYVPLREIANRQEISEKYLEIILKLLVKGNILQGLRGKGGGYMLIRKPEEYTVGEIIEITEGSLAPVACLEPNAKTAPEKEPARLFHCGKNITHSPMIFFIISHWMI